MNRLEPQHDSAMMPGGPEQVFRARGMVLIGATGRNAGKTALAEELIRRHVGTRPVIGVKVTTVHEDEGPCPRGSRGCGVCATLEGPYRLTEERGEQQGKDTTRLLLAGAGPVFWLCVRPSTLAQGLDALRRAVPDDAVVVAESNSLRKVVEPDLFVIVQGTRSRKVKPSCQDVWSLADEVVRFDGVGFDPPPDAFGIVDGEWTLRRASTAVVLAGGRSTRMGRDKALLPVAGRRMIEHIVDQLRPHFSEILISADDIERYAFLGLDVVPDQVSGQGPMRAIASVLERSSHEVVFVIPCDVPRVPSRLLAGLLRGARSGAEIVVPVTSDGHYEPLFAIYRKSVRDRLSRALERGQRRIVSVYDECDTRTLEMDTGDHLFNVNTEAEYEQLLVGS